MKNPFKEVFKFQKHEFPVVVSLFFFFFLVIAVFQILKPLKKGLFIEVYGAHTELYAKLGNIGVAALAVVAFTFLYNNLQRQRLIYVLSLFFIVSFLLLPAFLDQRAAVPIWSFYFLGDMVSTLMVVGFWAYATDISDPNQAKRLFGAMGAGGVIGGWAGSAWAKFLILQIGMNGLLVLSAVFMGTLILLVYFVEHWIRTTGAFRKPSPVQIEKKTNPAGESKTSPALEGAKLVMQSKYLAAIVGIMGFYEIASQVIDYQFSSLSEALEGVSGTQAFIANVYYYANFIAVIVQLLLVSLIMRKLGLIAALLVLPIAALGSSVAFIAVPTLFVASLLTMSENAFNYSIQQTARETLYVPTTPDEKYKARAFTNMFVQRFAKGLAIVALIPLTATGVAVNQLSWITITVVTLMALCGIYAGRRFSEKAGSEGRIQSGKLATSPTSG